MKLGSTRGGRRRSAFRWWFEDRRTGRLVFGQAPNATLLLFVAASGARVLASAREPAGAAVRLVQVGALGVWAADELLRGVNPFRRAGGAAVLLAAPFRRMLE